MQLFKNNAVSTLAATLSSSGDYISIASGTGNRFPEIDTDGDYFLLTLLDPSTGNKEIVKCISHQNADDVMQIERAQEGTVAQSFPVGTIVSMRVTAGLLDKLHPVDFVYDYENDLVKAISTIGYRDTTILIDREIQVNKDVTVPENICLKFTRRGKITVNTDPSTGNPYTLTINGSIEAGLWQIFSGDGTITGSPKIEAVYPEWFEGSDIGEKINKAIDFVPVSGVIFTSSNFWNGVNYSSTINVDKRVHLIFPGVRTKASFLGTECALKINITSGCVIKGFAVDLSTNTNTNVDGVVVFRSHDNIFTDGLHVEGAPRHGLVIDAENGGAYNNVFRGVLRIQGSGGSNIKITSSGTSLPNANSFYRVILGSCVLESILIEKGLNISFHDVYIQSGSSWAVKNISGYSVYFDYLVIDSNMAYGISATSPIFCAVLKNNANTTKFDGDSADQITYSDGNSFLGNLYARECVFQNLQTSLRNASTPAIYSTDGSGASYPFTEWGNLVIESRYGTYSRDFVFINNGEVTAVFHRTNRVDIYKMIRNVNIITFPDSDTTPSVADSNIFKTANTSATSITTFDNGVAGQEITVIFGDANTTIIHGSGIYLKGGVNITPSINTTMKFVFDGTYWYEA